MKSPFRFLEPYGKEDRKIFFGRDEEIEQLYNTSFSTDLILLYGQTGTGKTSLIRCGLANRFDKTDWFEVYIRREQNINRTMFSEIYRKAKKKLKNNASLTQAVHSLYLDYLKPVYLIFDQFEELFTVDDNKEEQIIFFNSIARLLDSGLSCKIILVLREEYLSRLHNFEKIVPGLFDHRVLIEPMYRAKLERVISGTLAYYNILLDPGSPAKALEQIIDNNTVNGVVHLPYLQVYLDRLYRSAHEQQTTRAAAQITFSSALIEDTGKVKKVMARFLDEQTAEIQAQLLQVHPQAPSQSIWLILNQFATEEGTTRPVEQQKIVSKFSPPHHVPMFCLNKLIEARILRLTHASTSEDSGSAVISYELTHDALAKHIDEKRSDEERAILTVAKIVKNRVSTYAFSKLLLSGKELNLIDYYYDKYKTELQNEINEQERQFIQKSKKRHLLKQTATRVSIIAVTMVIVLTVLLFIKWQDANANWQKAEKEKRINLNTSEALRLATAARSESESDPTVAIRLAQEALKIKSINITSSTLTSIYGEHMFYKITGHTAAGVTSAMFSADGSILLTRTKEDSIRLRLRGDIGFSPPKPYPTGIFPINAALLSARGDQILISSYIDDVARVYLLNVNPQPQNKPAVVYTIQSPGIRIKALAMSGDNNKILIGTSAGTVYLKNITQNNTREIHRMPNTYVESLAFSNHGRYLFAGYSTGAILLKELPSTRSIPFHSYADKYPSEPPVHHQLVRGVFSHSGGYLLTGSEDGTAALWLVSPNEAVLVHAFEPLGDKISCIYFSPDDKYLFIASRDVHVYLLQRPHFRFAILKGHTGVVQSITCSVDNAATVITTAADDNTIRQWTINGGLYSVFKRTTTAGSAIFSRDQRSVFLGFNDGSIHQTRLNGEEIKPISGAGSAAICSLTLTPDSLCAGTKNGTMRLFDTQHNLRRDLSLNLANVTGLAVSPDNSYILAWVSGTSARLWSVNLEGEFTRPRELHFDKHYDWLSTVVFSPGSKYLLSGSYDRTAVLWQLNGSDIEPVIDFKGHESQITSAAFSPDGQTIITGSLDKSARLWAVKNGQLLRLFKGFKSAVTAAALSDNYILTAVESGHILIWWRKEDPARFLQSGNVQPLSSLQKKEYKIKE